MLDLSTLAAAAYDSTPSRIRMSGELWRVAGETQAVSVSKQMMEQILDYILGDNVKEDIEAVMTYSDLSEVEARALLGFFLHDKVQSFVDLKHYRHHFVKNASGQRAALFFLFTNLYSDGLVSSLVDLTRSRVTREPCEILRLNDRQKAALYAAYSFHELFEASPEKRTVHVSGNWKGEYQLHRDTWPLPLSSRGL